MATYTQRWSIPRNTMGGSQGIPRNSRNLRNSKEFQEREFHTYDAVGGEATWQPVESISNPGGYGVRGLPADHWRICPASGAK